MTEKSRIDRMTDRLKGLLGLKQETSPKEDLSVAAESVARQHTSLAEIGWIPDGTITPRMAVSEDVEKYRELVISGQIDKYDPKFSEERSWSVNDDLLSGMKLDSLFRNADRPMCMIFGEILREAVADHAIRQKLGGSSSPEDPVFGFAGLESTGEIISRIGMDQIHDPFFRGPILDRRAVEICANGILQKFRSDLDRVSIDLTRGENETRDMVSSYIREISHDKMLDIQRAIRSGVAMEREFDRSLVAFQEKFQASHLWTLFEKGWLFTAEITDKLQSDSLFVTGKPLNDGRLLTIPPNAVGLDERIREAFTRQAS